MEPWLKNGIFPFDEKEWRRWFEKILPDGWQSLLNLSGPFETKEEQKPNPVRETVFETHENVFIRIPVEAKQLKKLKIYHSLNKCLIYGPWKDPQSPMTIILPAIVKKKGAKAVFREGILEIRLVKAGDWQWNEIPLDEDSG
jgi:hypothetical protein